MTTPKRVLHLEVGGEYGGSLRALELYLAYADRTRFKHDLLFYYRTPRSEGASSLVDRCCVLSPDAGPPQHRCRGPLGRHLNHILTSFLGSSTVSEIARGGFVRTPSRIAKLTGIIRSGHYDLVHVNNTFTYQLPSLLAARLTRMPLVAHVRNTPDRSLVARSSVRLAAMVVTVSQALEREVKTWNTRVPIVTCRDGVETPAVDQPAALALRRELLSAGGLLIGSVGRLDHQKGYDDLIRAARIVVNRYPNARFAIAGEGPLRPALEQHIADLNLTDCFHLRGFTADVGTFLAACDIFVSSSLWEGLPIAIVESMLLGIPVVATDVGGNAEAVIPQHTGLLVPPSDPASLAAAVGRLIDNQAEAKTYSREGYALAKVAADPAATAKMLDDLLEGALAQSPSSARA